MKRRSHNSLPAPLAAEADALRTRLLARGCTCGNCDGPPGRDPRLIVLGNSGPLGYCESVYLLCRTCAAEHRRHGAAALLRAHTKAREWAQLLTAPAAGEA